MAATTAEMMAALMVAMLAEWDYLLVELKGFSTESCLVDELVI